MEEMTLIEELHRIADRLREEDAEQAGEIRLVHPECCAVCKNMIRLGPGEQHDDEDLFVCRLRGGPVYFAKDLAAGFFAGCDRFEPDGEMDEQAVLELMAFGQKSAE